LSGRSHDCEWATSSSCAGNVPYTAAELVAHYRDADFFARPCLRDRGRKEGIPGLLVEAKAAGVPIVSTCHGGTPKVVENWREGLLVREGDVGQPAAALERVLVDETLRPALGTAAAERAARDLDVTQASEAVERIYDELRQGSP
jgi:glycosyltransferase involved in cell wall biosynthesis